MTTCGQGQDQTAVESGETELVDIHAYPHRFERTHTTSDIHQGFGELARGEESQQEVRAAGRVMAIRRHGHLTFLDLEDISGRIQICLRRNVLGPAFRDLDNALTRGDILGVTGRPFRTRSGELSVLAEQAISLARCLRPLPDKAHGIQDPALQRGRRHLDLLSSASSRKRFLVRSALIRTLREFLWARGFAEVETATLDTVYGGAEARPFRTTCNALKQEFFLRISPELALKRLIVGGMECVFEIGKQFRNEGIDGRHHPEFTSIEVYQAYADYVDMMGLTEGLLHHVATRLGGEPRVKSRMNGSEAVIDLTPPFRRLTVLDAVREYTGMDFAGQGEIAARDMAGSLGVTVSPRATADEVILDVFEARVEHHLIQPTFILDYPASLCPLTKRHRANPDLAERFELYIHGMEFANAYTELNDPAEQRRQFIAQARQRALGNDEAHLPDWEFVEALEYGMPPTGGLGIGIDRLAMLLTGVSHIQDVILFPLRGGERGD